MVSRFETEIKRRCNFSIKFHSVWFTNFTATEAPPLLSRAAVPEMSSDSNVYNAMARFVRGRDYGGNLEHPKCAKSVRWSNRISPRKFCLLVPGRKLS